MTNEELQQQIEQLEQQIKDLKVKLKEKAEKKAYEVEVPTDIYLYYTVNDCGEIRPLSVYTFQDRDELYKRGLTFKTKEEAEQFDKERILINKLKKWAEEHNGGWTPDWSDINENKYYIYYDHSMGSERLRIDLCWISEKFSKLPYFKTIEIARECVDLFGNEIIKVLC